MEIVVGVFFLALIALAVGALENHDNKTEIGKEILADMSGLQKVEAENRGCSLMFLALVLIVVTVLAVIAAGGV